MWLCEDDATYKAMSDLFGEAGITIHRLDSAKDIINAPAAALNIAQRGRWAQMMKRKYKTDYLRLDGSFEMAVSGGAESFYIAVAERLGKADEMRTILERKNSGLQARHEAIKAQYGHHRYVLCSWLYQPKNCVRSYQDDFGIFPEYIIGDINTQMMREYGASEEAIQKTGDDIEQGLRASGFTGTWIKLFDRDAVISCLSQTDIIVIGGDMLGWLYGNDPEIYHMKTIPQLPMYAPLGLSGRLQDIESKLSLVENASACSNSLTKRLARFEEENPSVVHNRTVSYEGNRRMWWDTL
jgi:hypothetical protein